MRGIYIILMHFLYVLTGSARSHLGMSSQCGCLGQSHCLFTHLCARCRFFNTSWRREFKRIGKDLSAPLSTTSESMVLSSLTTLNCPGVIKDGAKFTTSWCVCKFIANATSILCDILWHRRRRGCKRSGETPFE